MAKNTSTRTCSLSCHTIHHLIKQIHTTHMFIVHWHRWGSCLTVPFRLWWSTIPTGIPVVNIKHGFFWDFFLSMRRIGPFLKYMHSCYFFKPHLWWCLFRMYCISSVRFFIAIKLSSMEIKRSGMKYCLEASFRPFKSKQNLWRGSYLSEFRLASSLLLSWQWKTFDTNWNTFLDMMYLK